jgi:hypothetical protein
MNIGPGLSPAGKTGATGPAVVQRATGGDVALGADGATTVLAQVLTGIGASKKVIATFGVRVTVWPTATQAKASHFDCKVEAYVATDAAGVATVAFHTTPLFSTALAHTDLRATVCALAASTGGFTVTVARPTGVACTARARWVVDGTTWEEIP